MQGAVRSLDVRDNKATIFQSTMVVLYTTCVFR